MDNPIKQEIEPVKLCQVITNLLDEKKAQEIVCINVQEASIPTDYFIIASGSSSRHISALADYAVERLKPYDLGVRTEGQGTSDWVLINAGPIVIHLFHQEARTHYNLEALWNRVEKEAFSSCESSS